MAAQTKQHLNDEKIPEMCLKRCASAPSLTNLSNFKRVTLSQLHQTSGILSHVQIVLKKNISTEIYADIPVVSEEDITRNSIGNNCKRRIRRLSLPNNRNDVTRGFGDDDLGLGDASSNANAKVTSQAENQQSMTEAENPNDGVETSRDASSESCRSCKEILVTPKSIGRVDARQDDERLSNPVQLTTASENHLEENFLIMQGIQLHNSNFDEECNTTIRNGADATHQITKTPESDSDDASKSPELRPFVNSATTNPFKSSKSDEHISCSAQPSERSFRLAKAHSSEGFYLQNPLSSLTEYEEILSTRPRAGSNFTSSISRSTFRRSLRSSQPSSCPHTQSQHQGSMQRQHFSTDKERNQTQSFNQHSRTDHDKGYDSRLYQNSPRLASISDRRRRLLTTSNSLDNLKSKPSYCHASQELGPHDYCSATMNPSSQTYQFPTTRRNRESIVSKKFDSNQNQTPLTSNPQSTSQGMDSPAKPSHLATCHGISNPHLTHHFHSGLSGRRHMHHEPPHSTCHSRAHVDQRYHCHGDSSQGYGAGRHHHHFPSLSSNPHETSPKRNDYQNIASSHQHHPMPPMSSASEIPMQQPFALQNSRSGPGAGTVLPSFGSVQQSQPNAVYERPIYQSNQESQYQPRPMFQNLQGNEYQPYMPYDSPTFQLPLQNTSYQPNPNFPQTGLQRQTNQIPIVNPNNGPDCGPISLPINSTVPFYGTPGTVKITSPLKQSMSGIRSGPRNPSTFYLDANTAEIVECQQQVAQPIDSIERVIRYIPTNESYTIHASTLHQTAELDSKIITCENEINKNEMILDQLRLKLGHLKGMR